MEEGCCVVSVLAKVLIFVCYVNITIGAFTGSGTGNAGNAKVAVEIPVTLLPGKNTIDLLSLTAGLQVRLSSLRFMQFFILWKIPYLDALIFNFVRI
jgi:hypothetical protein